jgi:ribosomal protein S12 methylthiotransferase
LGERLTTTPKNYAYLKLPKVATDLVVLCYSIMHVSQTIEKLVKEAEGLARDGVKELILIAQDLTYYGLIFIKNVI